MNEWMKKLTTDQGLEGSCYTRQGGIPPWEAKEPKETESWSSDGCSLSSPPSVSLRDQNPRARWRPPRESAQPKATCALFLSGTPRMPCTSRGWTLRRRREKAWDTASGGSLPLLPLWCLACGWNPGNTELPPIWEMRAGGTSQG